MTPRPNQEEWEAFLKVIRPHALARMRTIRAAVWAVKSKEWIAMKHSASPVEIRLALGFLGD